MKNSSAISVLFACLFFLFSNNALAINLEGTYEALGTNPDGKGSYKGTVMISKVKSTYKLVWNVGAIYIGTGILTGNVLSVSFADKKQSWFGVVSYLIKQDGKILEGLWAEHKGTHLGKEVLTRL
jgi:hypothetical protein